MELPTIEKFCWKTPLLVEPGILEREAMLLPSKLIGEAPSLKLKEFQAKKEGYEVFKTQAQSNDDLNKLNGGFVPVYLVGNVAVMVLDGAFMQKPVFSKYNLYESVSTVEASEKLRALENAREVDYIVLDINSPGGEVAGVENLAAIIREVKETKPIIAVVNDFSFSAAYWIAASASEVVMSSTTAQLGSIGVYSIHADLSQAHEKQGVKITEISAGKFKTVGSPNRPLPDAEREIIQGRLNEIYSIFLNAVSIGRSMDLEKVKEAAEGKIFLAAQAISVGLADKIESLENVIINLRSGAAMANTNKGEKVEGTVATATKAESDSLNQSPLLTAEFVKEKAGEVYQEIFKAGEISGAEKERDRINAIDQQMIDYPGAKDLIEAAKKDPKQNAGTVATQIIKLMQSGKTEVESPKTNENAGALAALVGESQKVESNDALSPEDKDFAESVALIVGN